MLDWLSYTKTMAPQTLVRMLRPATYVMLILCLNHYNQFIVGTVWKDLDWDGMYDTNEGLGGVTVTPDAGTYYAITCQ